MAETSVDNFTLSALIAFMAHVASSASSWLFWRNFLPLVRTRPFLGPTFPAVKIRT